MTRIPVRSGGRSSRPNSSATGTSRRDRLRHPGYRSADDPPGLAAAGDRRPRDHRRDDPARIPGHPLVEIDGSGLAGAANDGLVITAGGSTIRGLSLVGFSDSAIVLESGGGNAIAGNYLGLAPSGTAAAPNQQGITLLGSSYNTIGVGSAGLGNVISGNSGDGVLIEPGGGANSAAANQVVGNRIGTSPRWPAGDRQRRFRDRRRGRRREHDRDARAGIRQRRLGERGPRDHRDGRSPGHRDPE